MCEPVDDQPGRDGLIAPACFFLPWVLSGILVTCVGTMRVPMVVDFVPGGPRGSPHYLAQVSYLLRPYGARHR